MYKAALFDLDGVIFDTEPLYTEFWERQGQQYKPDITDFAHRIKGMTLVQIYDQYYPGETALQQRITAALNDFEAHMPFNFIPGAHEFLLKLRQKGIKTAVVTSSNQAKMAQVYRQHPDFKTLFDAILTSEDFTRSKPDPECYLTGARSLGAAPAECVAFEDSVNGMRSVKRAGIYLVGLVTTNPREVVEKYADELIDDFTQGVKAIQ